MDDRQGSWALRRELERLRGQVKTLERQLRRERYWPSSAQRDELLPAVVEAATDMISTATLDGRILYMNRAGLLMVGLDPDMDVSQLRIADFHPPEEARRIIDEGIPGAVAKGTYRHEIELLHRDGHRIPASQVILAHRASDGGLDYLSTIVRDISEFRRAEQALRQSEHGFRSIVQASPMGMHIYHVDDDGRLIFEGANAAAERILGVEHQQFVGRPLEEAFPPLVETEVPRRYLQAAREGIPWNTAQVFYEDRQISGAYEVYAFQTSPGRMVAMFLDVTERLRTEQEHARLRHELQQAQKMEAVGRLAGGVAHDFNNLLMGISGCADLVLESDTLPAPLRPDVEEIARIAVQARDLTQQLLAFSRKQLTQPTALDVNEVIVRSQRMLRRLIGEDVALDVELGREVWPVLADPGQLHQVLVNLATNARDAMPLGGRLVFSTSNTTLDATSPACSSGVAPGDYVRIDVQDSGSGMDEATRERAFEPFFTTKEPGRGTGLGLSTVHGIIKQNRGHIDVDSGPEGTRFTILLPRTEALPEGKAAAQPATNPAEGGETILVVEDDAAVRRLVARMLTRYGYEVISAGTPAEARTVAHEHEGRIALLLTDVVMPQANGRALCEQLRSERPDLRVLYMSGYTDDVIAPHGVLEEGIPLIAKPFTHRELAEMVRKILDQ